MKVIDLEDKSGDTEDTGQTGAGEGSGLASTGGRDRNGLGGGDGTGGGDSGLADDGSGDGDGAVLGGSGAVVALDHGRGDDWLGDSAGAVSDGQGGGRGDGVGLVTVGDDSSGRAVGGVGRDDLSDVGDVLVSQGAGGGEDKGGSGELHFDGFGVCFGMDGFLVLLRLGRAVVCELTISLRWVNE